jgi:cytochrome P450
MMNRASEILDAAQESGVLAADPAAVYRKMFDTGERSCYSRKWDAPVIFYYADVASALRDPQAFSNSGRVVNHLKMRFPEAAEGELRLLATHYSRGLINSDPPDHTRLRKLIQAAFLPRIIERLRPRVEELCRELLDAAEEKREIDWVADFAFLLPVTVIAELLGIPQQMRHALKDWSSGIVEFMSTPTPSLDAMRRSQTALLELRDYFASLFPERRKHPGDDLISLLAATEVDGDRLTEDELQGTCVTLLIGGHETTTSLLTSAVWLIGDRPELRSALMQNQKIIPSAVEEFLRFAPPFQRILRVATRDLEWAGQSISAGQTVVLLLGAANRDGAQFPDPDRLSPDRTPNKHVAFGYGVHHCLGAALARMEAPAALSHLLARFPDFRLIGRSSWHDGMVRSLPELRLALL